MPKLSQPGVMINRSPVSRHIEPLPWGLPAFIAPCIHGPSLTPTRVANWADFTTRFGPGMERAVNRAVYAYFLNCPHPAYVVHCPITAGASNGERLLAYQRAIQAAVGIDLSAVLLPGVSWKGHGKTILRWAVGHCDRLGDRSLLIDAPAGLRLTSQPGVSALALPASPSAAIYYPWVRFENPDAVAGGDPRVPRTVSVPASALAAAVWSNTDHDRGVWKAPAGTGSSLIGVRRLRFGVDSGVQAELNPLGINCLRRLPGAGTVIWGARTLGGNADPQWRYLSATRTARYIRSSIERGTRWTVFEPNEPRLWSQLRAAVDAFMNGLLRAGALQGEKPAEAWFVQVGLGETMSRHDINRGRVVMRIGCALARPAEFTVVTVTQKAAG